jgi:hypothetical protein
MNTSGKAKNCILIVVSRGGKMVTRTIRENDELKEAIEEKVDRIIVKGELAEHLNIAMKIKIVSKWTITLLTASLAATPLTGAFNLALFAPIAALTGLEATFIIAVATIGTGLVLLICRDYKKTSYQEHNADGETEVVIERF